MSHAVISPQTKDLILAIGKRDLIAARSSIARGADCLFCDKDGRGGLHLAALQGDIEMVKLLIDHGADILARDNTGKTAREIARPPSGGNRVADDTFNRFLGLPTEENMKSDYKDLIDYLAKAEIETQERIVEQTRLHDEAFNQNLKNLKNKGNPRKFRL